MLKKKKKEWGDVTEIHLATGRFLILRDFQPSNCGSADKESACNAGDLGLIPGLGSRSSGEGKGYPLQYSGLENSMDCMVHEVEKSQTTEWLSLHFVAILHFIILRIFCVFYKLKVCVNLVYWCHFSNQICSLHVCHFLIVLAIFQNFYYYYVMGFVINDVWCYHYRKDYNFLKTRKIVRIL